MQVAIAARRQDELAVRGLRGSRWAGRAGGLVPARLFVALACAGVILLGGLPEAQAGSTSPYGLNIHAPAGEGLALLEPVAAAGIEWVRIDLVWALVQPVRGVWDWSLYDALVDAADTEGLEILAILAYTPPWATDGTPLAGVPRDVAEWEEFCFRAAERYGDRIRYWEIWNEPNLEQFWEGSRNQYLDRILLPGLAAVDAAPGDARVGGPGLAHLVSGDRDWYRWLSDVLDRAGSRLDFLSHHAYDDEAVGLGDKLDGDTLFGSQPALWDVVPPSLLEVLDAAGWGGRPVWLTETGWASDEIGEAGQARELGRFLGDWMAGDRSRSWIHKVFLYELIDDPTPGNPKFGLLRADGSPKPAASTLAGFVAAHPRGPGDASVLLVDDRFEVKVLWRDHGGRTGSGRANGYSDNTGTFWFFDPQNLELIVKVLDGRPVNGAFWLFYGALSDVEYWVEVTDRVDGRVRSYRNPPGNLCGRADTGAFVPLGDLPEDELVAASESPILSLRDGRFRVQVDWRDPRGVTGRGTAVPATDDSGFFWFFRPGNLELVVKVLDGRPVNGHFWVYYGALSDVEYTIRVTDSVTGTTRRYRNPQGELCGGSDIEAFAP